MQTEFKCKHCNSSRLNKTGIQRTNKHRYQRYICRDCYRLSVFKLADAIAEVGIDSAGTSASVKDGVNHAF